LVDAQRVPAVVRHVGPGAALAVFLAMLVLGMGLTVVRDVYLTGPSRVAVVTRTGCRRGIGALRDVTTSVGLRPGAVGRIVHRFKRWIGVVVAVVAVIVPFTWTYPNTTVVVWTAVITLVALAVREFLDYDEATPPAGSGSGGGAAAAH